jgi:SAM-dependent methyltransferase
MLRCKTPVILKHTHTRPAHAHTHRLLKPGGVLLMDDYLGGINPKWPESQWAERATLGMVYHAANAFLSVYRDRLRVIYSAYQLHAIKLY